MYLIESDVPRIPFIADENTLDNVKLQGLFWFSSPRDFIGACKSIQVQFFEISTHRETIFVEKHLMQSASAA